MAFIGKTYKHQKDEQFKEFLDSLGVPEDRSQVILSGHPTQKLEKNGDEYVLITEDAGKTKEIKFKSGVEFDENVTESIDAKTTFTVDGAVVKQVQKFADGKSITIDRQYSGNDLVVMLKTSFWDGCAKRFYTAA